MCACVSGEDEKRGSAEDKQLAHSEPLSFRCVTDPNQRERRSSNDKLTTTNKRNKERRVGGVRDANDRSERRDIWPGARGGGEGVSWRRRREHESSSSVRKARQASNKRAAARERGKNRGRTFPPKSHRAPSLSSRQTPNNKVCHTGKTTSWRGCFSCFAEDFPLVGEAVFAFCVRFHRVADKVNIACGTIMPFDLVSSSRYAHNHTGGSR